MTRLDTLKENTTKGRLLNICLVSREYPEETGWGGIGQYTYHLAHGLVALGHSVHVLAQSLSVDNEYHDGKVMVHRIAYKPLFFVKSEFNEFCSRIEYSYNVYVNLKELIKKYNIDIIEGPNLFGETFVYSFFKRTPLITRLHTPFSEVVEFRNIRKSADIRLSCLLEDSTIMRSDLVTCSTKNHTKTIFNEIGSRKSRTEIIPLGVPLPELKKTSGSSKKAPLTVLFVGRLESRKGAHILAQAIPRVLEYLPETRFLIIGRDTFGNAFSGEKKYSFKEKMINDITRKHLKKVEFLGYVDNTSLTDHYRKCDLFVAPSLYESFGFIYVEAMSYGKPVIGCNVGGVPEVINNNVTGLLVPPADHIQLAEAIMKMLTDRPLREKMGREARKHVEANFSRKLMSERTVRAYQECLG